MRETRRNARQGQYFIQCSARSRGKGERQTVKQSFDTNYKPKGAGVYSGYFATESEARQEATRFRLFLEFGRAPALKWGKLDVEQQDELVQKWSKKSPALLGNRKAAATTTMADHTEVKQFVKVESRKSETDLEKEIRKRKQERFKLMSDMREAATNKETYLIRAKYCEAQARELQHCALTITFVCDAEGASVKQGLKVTKQCFAVACFYTGKAARERALADGAKVSEMETLNDLSDRVALGFGNTGRTLRTWVSEWDDDGCFQLDQRGTSSASTLIAEEEVETAVREEMVKQVKKKGKDAISVDSMHEWINSTLLPGLDTNLKALYGMPEGHTICRTTAYTWMKAAGGVATWFAPVHVFFWRLTYSRTTLSFLFPLFFRYLFLAFSFS